MKKEKTVYVWENWTSALPQPVGELYIENLRGRETYSFSFNQSFLARVPVRIDPELELYPGRQYTADGSLFKAFADACPDRWGRTLMKRREALRAEKENEKPRKLLESDYLLGVYDEGRMGGFRFSLKKEGSFLSDDAAIAVPPMEDLRNLEAASRKLADGDDEIGKWLSMLLAPGSSLGGARPKATVKDTDGALWIAKFPSLRDERDVGAWEMVAHELARLCGLSVPEAKTAVFSKQGTTFLVRRFDRAKNKRIHFASAMTMLNRTDGDHDASYLEIAEFLSENGTEPQKDIEELWKRIVFSMLVSNIDDHLRNHGFLLDGNGWRLSPLYDVNPVPEGTMLSLSIDMDNKELSLELAEDVSPLYGLGKKAARSVIISMKKIVAENWSTIASNLGIQQSEIRQMAPAFQLSTF